MKVAVRITGPGRVVPDHGRLDLLDRHLHLPPTRPNSRGGVLGDPCDDLDGGLVLCFVQRGRDLWMKRRGQGPRLGSVDGDLDEPQRLRVVADPTLLKTGADLDAGDPLLVGVPGHGPRILEAAWSRGQTLSDASAFGKVVVISPRAITLDVGARRLRCAAVELHPTV